jgi:hypothetical protein
MYCTFVLFVNHHFPGLPASGTHSILTLRYVLSVNRHEYFYFERRVPDKTFRRLDTCLPTSARVEKSPISCDRLSYRQSLTVNFSFQLAAVAVIVSLIGLATPAPQGLPPPGRNFPPRFLPLTPQGYVPIVSANFDLDPVDNSYNFK